MAKPKGKSSLNRGKRLSNVKRANIGTNKRLKERKSQIRSSQASNPKLKGFTKTKAHHGRPKKAMFAFAAAQKAGYVKRKRINFQQSRPDDEDTEAHGSGNEEEEEEDPLDDDFEEEDMEYIQSMAGAEGFLSNVQDSLSADTPKSRKARKHEGDNTLASYEQQPRSKMSEGGPERDNMKPLLPIKHASGLEYRWIEKEDGVKEEVMEESGDVPVEELEPLPPISTVQLLARRHEKLEQKKRRIAALASAIVEDPEKNISKLKDLRLLLDTRDPDITVTVRKLVMVSLAEVFKDITPGYRIREWGEKAKSVELSKGVKSKRDFEEGLVVNYRHYLEFLEKTIHDVHKTKKQLKKEKEKEKEKELQRSKPRLQLPDEAKLSLAEVATQCLCLLLNALPHFNFRTNIISVVANQMTSKHEKISTTCCQCFKQLFKGDSSGETSLEAVRYISRIARNHGYQISPAVLNTFLSLRIKEVKTGNTAEENRKKMLQDRKEKFKRLSRSQKRYHKRLEKLEKELQATEASENKNKKLKLHTEIVQIVFATYFRILKRASYSVMLPSVLEGLAKFAHLINVEFFDDLIQVLHSLIAKGGLQYRESLHCTLTAFHILSGQGDVLNIDPSKFYAHLYITLPLVHAGVSSNDARLVCDSLEVMISKRRKQITVQRVLGFLKRLSTVSLLGLPNAAIAYMCAVRTFMKWYPKTDVLLDNESTGSGTFLPEVNDPEHCHAQNTAFWELHFLQNHYHPVVRDYAAYLLSGCPTSGHGVLNMELLRMKPKDILKTYNPSNMKFNPPLQPKHCKPSKKALKIKERHATKSDGTFIQEDFKTLLDAVEQKIPDRTEFSRARDVMTLAEGTKSQTDSMSQTKMKVDEMEPERRDQLSNGHCVKTKVNTRTVKINRKRRDYASGSKQARV